jgi:hypothetical protein
MMDLRQAVQIAKERAAEMFGPERFLLEEIERESYKGHEVWSITLSLPDEEAVGFAQLSNPRKYKRFLIDAETGELVAMKLREVA